MVGYHAIGGKVGSFDVFPLPDVMPDERIVRLAVYRDDFSGGPGNPLISGEWVLENGMAKPSGGYALEHAKERLEQETARMGHVIYGLSLDA